ncbi:MAG: hypothetical protein JXA69_14545 [Phycisphaerae bacterium]|nr:hypothetical protein [Phycisphaerae bacterium]
MRTPRSNLIEPDTSERPCDAQNRLSPWSPRRAIGLSAIVLSLVLIGHTAFALVAPPELLVTKLPDDAWYFIKIAQNYSSGLGWTFDGLNETNGFQPLWTWLLAGLYSIVPQCPTLAYRLALIVQIIFIAISALLLLYTQSRILSPGLLVVSMAVFAFYVPTFHNGMESAILVLTLSLLYFFTHQAYDRSTLSIAQAAVLGCVLGLAVLARLDMVFLVIPLAVLLYLRVARPGKNHHDVLRFALPFFGGLCGFLLPYLLYNAAYYGTVMPISGALKTSFPYPGFYTWILRVRGNAVLLALAAIWLMVGWYYRRRIPTTQGCTAEVIERMRFQFDIVSVLAIYVVLHGAHTILFMRWGVFFWHFASYQWFACILAPVLMVLILERIPRRVRGSISTIIIALILVGCARHAAALPTRGQIWKAQSYAAALWARGALPADTVLAMSDAGVFGYFSQRRVINLDGIVNNIEYQEALRDGRLRSYLNDRGVRYVVHHAVYDRQVVEGTYERIKLQYQSHLFPGRSGSLTLRAEDEVYRSEFECDALRTRSVFLIWMVSGVADPASAG